MSGNDVVRYGPVSLSSTDADDGARLYLSADVIEDSGIDPDGAVLIQPYQDGIHVIDAAEAVLGDSETGRGEDR